MRHCASSPTFFPWQARCTSLGMTTFGGGGGGSGGSGGSGKSDRSGNSGGSLASGGAGGAGGTGGAGGRIDFLASRLHSAASALQSIVILVALLVFEIAI